MKRGTRRVYLMVIVAIMACILFLPNQLFASQTGANEMNIQWAEKTFSGKSGSELPFSFVYDGKKSTDFIYNWESKVKDETVDAGRRVRTLKFTDSKTGLQVKAVVTMYTDTAGIDWTLYFTNTGKEDTPIIQNVKAVDVKVKHNGKQLPLLHRLEGTGVTHVNFYCFEPYDEAVSSGKKIDFGVGGINSSSSVSPFFNVAWDGGGVLTAVGWTGHWGATVENTAENEIRLDAGMRRMHLRLHPGESIRSPRIMQVYWTGNDEFQAWNMFRQTMLKHILPKVNGKTVIPPMATLGSCFVEGGSTNIGIEKSHVDAAKKLGFESYWMDAEWQNQPVGPQQLFKNVGNYGFPIERVQDPKKFPDGPKALGDYVHSNGMKFILWFAPEFVAPETYLAKEYPEWLLPEMDEGFLTYSLGIPEAREYMTRYLNTVIKEYGIDILRLDMYPSWKQIQANDKDPNRIGMTEIRHVEGVYRMWDDVLQTNPHIFIDNCAGGSNRVDLETCSRSLPLWRTDRVIIPIMNKQYDEIAIRNQVTNIGMNRYMPFGTTGTLRPEPYYFRSGFNGGIAFCDDERKADYQDMMKQAVKEGKRIRKYWFGNFYPISEMKPSAAALKELEDNKYHPEPRNSADPKAWCVMQYHRPDKADGLVMAFRRHESPYVGFVCGLREIDPAAKYSVQYSYTYQPMKLLVMKGSELQNLKLDIKECPGSVIVEYKKL